MKNSLFFDSLLFSLTLYDKVKVINTSSDRIFLTKRKIKKSTFRNKIKRIFKNFILLQIDFKNFIFIFFFKVSFLNSVLKKKKQKEKILKQIRRTLKYIGVFFN